MLRSLEHLSWPLVAVLVVAISATIAYPLERALATTLFAIVVCGSLLLAPRRLGVLSWTAGIPLFYAVMFLVLPTLAALLGVEERANPYIPKAFYVAALGIAAFAGGVATTRVIPVQGTPTPWHVSFSTPFIALLICVGAGAKLWSYFFGYFGLIHTGSDQIEAGAGLMNSLAFLLTLAHVIAWNTYFREKRLLFMAVFSTILMAAFAVVANSKEQMLLPFLLIGVSLWGVTGKFPYKLVMATVLLYIFVAFPFVTVLRMIAPLAGERSDVAEVAVDQLFSVDWADADLVQIIAGKALERGALLAYFADIVHQAGQSVPLLNGRTLTVGLEAMVPRALYPDKPDMDIGNWTGQMFGAVAPWDDVTNLSPTYMGEFYMNFGILGVLGGMFVIGNLAVLVDRYAIRARWTWTMPIVFYFVRWQESFVGHTIFQFGKTALFLVSLFVVWKYGLRPVLLVATRPRPAS